ncbi:MAG TPA: hypothetical protein DEQ47_08470 [Solibacterales bacterium]|nr:hypothetical protein [Bryobacterales bacterium]
MWSTNRAVYAVICISLGAIPLLAQQPSISAIQNNYSYTLPTVPNYGIAPGSLFVIFGSNLSTVTTPVLQSSAAPGVPLTLNGVTVTASINGTVAKVPLYYVSTTQIAGILTASVPAGTGTITVTNNGQASAPAPLQVVASDFGILTTNNAGSGSAAAYDANNKLLTATNSARPGQTIVLWGSGVGADPGNDDRIFPQKQNNLSNIPVQVFMGGASAPVVYRGRSQFPGVDQIDVTVPAGVPTGCYVSLVVMSGNVVSNSTTLPIAPNGGTCSDPNTEFTAAQLQALSNKSSVNVGTMFISQEANVARNLSRNVFRGKFLNYASADFNARTPSPGFLSYGSCQILTKEARATHLDVGPTLTVLGPGGEQGSASPTTQKDGTPGDYVGSLPDGFIPSGGGSFTFSNGSGSAAVGPFNAAAVTMPPPLTWTNMGGISTINRSQGVTVTWSGGSPGTFVMLLGAARISSTSNAAVSFACAASLNSGQFTIPPSLLLAVPAGTGQLILYNVTAPAPFSAPGLDLGAAFAEVGWNIPVMYQ